LGEGNADADPLGVAAATDTDHGVRAEIEESSIISLVLADAEVVLSHSPVPLVGLAVHERHVGTAGVAVIAGDGHPSADSTVHATIFLGAGVVVVAVVAVPDEGVPSVIRLVAPSPDSEPTLVFDQGRHRAGVVASPIPALHEPERLVRTVVAFDALRDGVHLDPRVGVRHAPLPVLTADHPCFGEVVVVLLRRVLPVAVVDLRRLLVHLRVAGEVPND